MQVKRLVGKHSIHPHLVRVPGILVDYVCVAENPEDHWQTYGEDYNPTYTGDRREQPHELKVLPLDLRKVVQRRAMFELRKWKRPIVTEIVAAGPFTKAEDYHQDYLQKHPGGYTCHFMRD